MKVAHTPGPWRLVQDHPDPSARLDIAYIKAPLSVPFNGREIAVMFLMEEPYQQANAQVIEAAPDLLEALEGLLSAWDEKETDNDRLCEIDRAAREAVKKARMPK